MTRILRDRGEQTHTRDADVKAYQRDVALSQESQQL